MERRKTLLRSRSLHRSNLESSISKWSGVVVILSRVLEFINFLCFGFHHRASFLEIGGDFVRHERLLVSCQISLSHGYDVSGGRTQFSQETIQELIRFSWPFNSSTIIDDVMDRLIILMRKLLTPCERWEKGPLREREEIFQVETQFFTANPFSIRLVIDRFICLINSEWAECFTINFPHRLFYVSHEFLINN